MSGRHPFVRPGATRRAAALLPGPVDGDPLDAWLVAHADLPMAAQGRMLGVRASAIERWRRPLIAAGRITPCPPAVRALRGGASTAAATRKARPPRPSRSRAVVLARQLQADPRPDWAKVPDRIALLKALWARAGRAYRGQRHRAEVAR